MSELTQGAPRKKLPPETGAYVEFLEGEEQGRKIPLVYARTILGRKFADILVRDGRVSGSHVAIEFHNGRFQITDLGSSNGTFIEGRKVKECAWYKGERLQIGDSILCLRINQEEAHALLAQYRLRSGVGGLRELIEREFLHLENNADSTQAIREASSSSELKLVIKAGPDRGKEFVLKKKKTIIGRAGADIALSDADVSRKHALLEFQEGGTIVLHDLASTNGTKVNQQKVTNMVLSEGDAIFVGSTILFLERQREK